MNTCRRMTMCLCRSTPCSICSEENPAVKLTVSSNPIGDSKENLEFNLDGIGLRLVLVGLCQQQYEMYVKLTC